MERLVASQGLAIFKHVCIDKHWHAIILAFVVNIILTLKNSNKINKRHK